MKIALCFIINYKHVLNKEDIWREWIEPNKDIINVYFYYKELQQIKSPWILQHTIAPNIIRPTNYYHVIPAYLGVLNYAYTRDVTNMWFCILSEACCPIISPRRFRYLFFTHYQKSIFNYKPAWWNPQFHHRANLAKLPKSMWLGNDPWFTLSRQHLLQVLHFVKVDPTLTATICDGGLANESLFAIALSQINKHFNSIPNVILHPTHIVDWSRMSSATSPYVFTSDSEINETFIQNQLNKNKYAMFIRKISPQFPNNTLKKFIYQYSLTEDSKLVWREPWNWNWTWTWLIIIIYKKIDLAIRYILRLLHLT